MSENPLENIQRAIASLLSGSLAAQVGTTPEGLVSVDKREPTLEELSGGEGNPFGALPGETYEEYQARALREINLFRIENGLPPLEVDPTTGEGIAAALSGLEELKQGKRDMPDIPAPQGGDDSTLALILQTLKGLFGGDFGQPPSLGPGTQPPGILQDAASLQAAERNPDLISGGGAAFGIDTNTLQMIGRLAELLDQTGQQADEVPAGPTSLNDIEELQRQFEEHKERVRREAEAG
jgi:hypothetical protein